MKFSLFKFNSKCVALGVRLPMLTAFEEKSNKAHAQGVSSPTNE